ncbi:zinc-dependent alcohol dehydrogenase family protein [Streptomyces sp. NPDC017988]|uniref:zinc-dependent alcohol dehydrogenase family protein n=1 Tax=Streptomyces sp. NPDC017988 TaxID=3365025 RepID=UPI0037AFE51B
MMRSVVFARYGAPADVLTVTETSKSEPAAGEVRVRVTARPINPSDLLLVQGRYGRAARFCPVRRGGPPVALVGFEGAGVLDKAAPDVHLQPGTRVAVSALGTWQEYLNVPLGDVTEVPDDMPDKLACQMTINPMTANLLLDDLALRGGDVLLQSAATSAVGRMITSLARRRGIRCAGLIRRPHPDSNPPDPDVLHVLAEPSRRARERIAEFAGAQGVAAAIDAVGGAAGRLMLDCLRDGGRMVVYGMLSGTAIPLPSELLVFRGISVDGFWLPERLARMFPEEAGELSRRVADQLTNRHLNAPVAKSYDLADVKKAVQHCENSPGGGKTLLVG